MINESFTPVFHHDFLQVAYLLPQLVSAHFLARITVVPLHECLTWRKRSQRHRAMHPEGKVELSRWLRAVDSKSRSSHWRPWLPLMSVRQQNEGAVQVSRQRQAKQAHVCLEWDEMTGSMRFKGDIQGWWDPNILGGPAAALGSHADDQEFHPTLQSVLTSASVHIPGKAASKRWCHVTFCLLLQLSVYFFF